MLYDEDLGGRHPARHLVGLLRDDRRRQADLAKIEGRVESGMRTSGHCGPIILGDKAAGDMAVPDAQLQHYRGVAGLGQREPLFDAVHDRAKIGPRVHQPGLRFHREGIGAFLDDGRAVAVILAQDHQRAAGHPCRTQVRDGIRGHIGADG